MCLWIWHRCERIWGGKDPEIVHLRLLSDRKLWFASGRIISYHIMALTVDDVMEKIGSFHRYQYRLLFIFGFMKIFGDGFQVMIPTFLSIEPPWRCKENSTACNLTGTFKPGDKNYNFRCSIPRDQWEFDTSDLNSVVNEVRWSIFTLFWSIHFIIFYFILF